MNYKNSRKADGSSGRRNSVNQIILTGIVLSTMPVGEYDRRVVIPPKQERSRRLHGARRPEQSLCRYSSPFSFGTFTMYRGEDVLHDTVGKYF